MNTKEAYARLLVLKYVVSRRDEEHRIQFILPRKYVSDDVKSLISGLYTEEGNTLVLVNPVAAMMELMKVEPFSFTHERYSKKYLIPEKLFILNNMGKWVTNSMYFLRKRDKEVYLGGDWYELVKEEGITKSIRKYELKKDGNGFVAILEELEERPPLRGLVFNKEDIADENINYVIDSVRLAVLSHNKFSPQREIAGTVTDKDGRVCEIWRIMERDPVLGINRDLFKISKFDEKKRVILSKHMDATSYPERTFVDMLSHYLEEHGFESLSQKSFDDYVTTLIFEEGGKEMENGGA